MLNNDRRAHDKTIIFVIHSLRRIFVSVVTSSSNSRLFSCFRACRAPEQEAARVSSLLLFFSLFLNVLVPGAVFRVQICFQRRPHFLLLLEATRVRHLDVAPFGG